MNKHRIRLGVIGCGIRATSVLQTLLEKHPECDISAVADANRNYTVAQLRHRGLPYENAVFHANIGSLLECADKLDALIIGSRCHQHTPMTVQAAAIISMPGDRNSAALMSSPVSSRRSPIKDGVFVNSQFSAKVNSSHMPRHLSTSKNGPERTVKYPFNVIFEESNQ